MRTSSSGRPHAPDPVQDYPLAEAGRAADDVSDNVHLGKVGVLCMAPETGWASSTTRCASSTSPRSRASRSEAGSDALQRGRPEPAAECGRIVQVTPDRAPDDHGRARTVAALEPQRTRRSSRASRRRGRASSRSAAPAPPTAGDGQRPDLPRQRPRQAVDAVGRRRVPDPRDPQLDAGPVTRVMAGADERRPRRRRCGSRRRCPSRPRRWSRCRGRRAGRALGRNAS